MKVLNNYSFYTPKPYYSPAFAGKIQPPPKSSVLKHIGYMPNGKIGEIEFFRKDGWKVPLKVIKSADGHGNELYTLENEFGDIVGEMDIKINRVRNYNVLEFPNNPSHIHVDFLCNHSDPKTNYYNDVLGEYEHVGTRLLQIALQRSEEAFGHRNIKLSSVPKAKTFYKKLGFTEIPDNSGRYNGYMCLFPEGAKTLAEMYGGLKFVV